MQPATGPHGLGPVLVDVLMHVATRQSGRTRATSVLIAMSMSAMFGTRVVTSRVFRNGATDTDEESRGRGVPEGTSTSTWGYRPEVPHGDTCCQGRDRPLTGLATFVVPRSARAGGRGEVAGRVDRGYGMRGMGRRRALHDRRAVLCVARVGVSSTCTPGRQVSAIALSVWRHSPQNCPGRRVGRARGSTIQHPRLTAYGSWCSV